MKRFCAILAILLGLFAPVLADAEISPRLIDSLEQMTDSDTVKVWVYFSDKGKDALTPEAAMAALTIRALERRRTIPPDWYDIPVNEQYVASVGATGATVRRSSRWLNALSCRANSAQIDAIAELPYVDSLTIVAILSRPPLEESPPVFEKPLIDSTIYGTSFVQNQMLGIDSLHKVYVGSGSDSSLLNGSGVLIAFFDTGYDTSHVTFDSLNILDTYDFIDDDVDVTDNDRPFQTSHGTSTLSACGGFTAGELIGPAYKADYVLAKTEIYNEEIQIEEDNWVAAAEWADLIGVDVISSSLGYFYWYTYADMDGNTAVTTIAADIAASRGILVVTSAGNEGNDAFHYITAPADGDSVVAVGAVASDGLIASFSSFGPSVDGRIKPEVVARGTGVKCATDAGGFVFRQGTSLSCPLIAGAAALLLQANPGLRGDPMAIRQRLIESGDRYQNPDNRYGYGLPDMVAAVGFSLEFAAVPPITVRIGTDTTITFSVMAPPGQAVIFDPFDIPDGSVFDDTGGDNTATLSFTATREMVGEKVYHIAAQSGTLADTVAFSLVTLASEDVLSYGPNPFSDVISFFADISSLGSYRLNIFTIAGEQVFSYEGSAGRLDWDGRNGAGQNVASGVYIILFSADGIEKTAKVYKR